MTTFWCYDYACTLHEEWTFLLRSDWSKVKGLYIVTRYLPFSFLAVVLWMSFNTNENPGKCWVLIILDSGLGIALVFLSECFFMLRTYVLWNNNRILLAAMLSTFFAFLVASFGFVFGTYIYTVPAGCARCHLPSGVLQSLKHSVYSHRYD
ncbi:hypothetical protein BDR04DRAFT_451729 [Suillus decipiens]|nr:hypothetical protein BDR04DRAFT_451729 [Suillus decipiens]